MVWIQVTSYMKDPGIQRLGYIMRKSGYETIEAILE